MFLSDNATSAESLDGIISQLKMYHNSGTFAQDIDDFDAWIEKIADSVRTEKGWGETNSATTTSKYIAIGRDGNFQSVLKNIGHNGKGIAD